MYWQSTHSKFTIKHIRKTIRFACGILAIALGFSSQARPSPITTLACGKLLSGAFGLSSAHYMADYANKQAIQPNKHTPKAIASSMVAGMLYTTDKTKNTPPKLVLDRPILRITQNKKVLKFKPLAGINICSKASTHAVQLYATDVIPRIQARKRKQSPNLSMTLLEALLVNTPTIKTGCEVALPQKRTANYLVYIDLSNLSDAQLGAYQQYLARVGGIDMSLKQLKKQRYWLGFYARIVGVTEVLLFFPIEKIQ